ncbi:hypothetical protein FB451DRAFT_1251067 [Mycena latifolia]|nr:hypothetical protein FB451DRAFT_1251067 [Mycena latifolia]
MSDDSEGWSFNAIAEMTTCTPATITWNDIPGTIASFAGINLTITNSGVTQNPPPPASSASGLSATHSARAWHRSYRYARGAVTQDIADDVDSSTGTYTWASVNITQGWYSLTATSSLGIPDQHSKPFFVVNGTDTSCFGGTASRSISSSSHSSSVSPTSQSVDAVSHATSASPTNSLSAAGTSLAPATARHAAKFPPGAIAGIVVGALLVLVAGILVFLRIRSRRARARSSSVSPFPPPSGGTVPDTDRASTILAVDRPIATSVVESQAQMFDKIARVQEDMRALEREGEGSDSDTPDMAGQLRAMAERVALMEVHIQTLSGDRPPDYTSTAGDPP